MKYKKFTSEEKKRYKSYPLPWARFISFFAVCIADIALSVDFAAYLYMVDSDLTTKNGMWFGGLSYLFTNSLAVVIHFVLYALLLLLTHFIFRLFNNKKKVYRGLSWQKLNDILTIDCEILYYAICIVILVFSVYIKAYPSFYGYFAIAFHLLTPKFLAYLLPDYTICVHCGLMNTLGCRSSSEKDLGVAPEFHTEGGYYENVTSYGDVYDENFSRVGGVSYNSRRYVPKTTVYGGMYEHTERTLHYVCRVCGSENDHKDYVKRKLFG